MYVCAMNYTYACYIATYIPYQLNLIEYHDWLIIIHLRSWMIVISPLPEIITTDTADSVFSRTWISMYHNSMFNEDSLTQYLIKIVESK